MRKILCILSIFLLLFLCSCGGNAELQKKDARIAELELQVEQLQNTPANLYASGLEYQEESRHGKALEAFQTILEKYPASEEAKLCPERIAESEQIIAEANAKLEAAAEEAAKTAKEEAQAIIRVTNVYPSRPNSAGGVDLYINWVNQSDKTIKYIYFTAVPYNAVGDAVSCEIRNNSTCRAKSTGPYAKGQGVSGGSYYWSCAWYNSTIKTVELTKIEIEYMDGSTATLSGDDIGYVMY